MAKKLIRLAESDLHRIVKESVQRILKEGSTSQEAFNYWDEIKERLGADGMIMELWNWLDSDSIDDFIQHIDRNYELGLFNEPEEEFDDEEEIY